MLDADEKSAGECTRDSGSRVGPSCGFSCANKKELKQHIVGTQHGHKFPVKCPVKCVRFGSKKATEKIQKNRQQKKQHNVPPQKKGTAKWYSRRGPQKQTANMRQSTYLHDPRPSSRNHHSILQPSAVRWNLKSKAR